MASNITVMGQIGRVFQNTNEQTGKESTTFDVTDSWKKPDDTYEKVRYVCTIWGARGNTIKNNFESGAPIYVTGTIRGVSIKPDKNGGDDWVKIILWVNDFSFMPTDFSESNKKAPKRAKNEEAEEIDFN